MVPAFILLIAVILSTVAKPFQHASTRYKDRNPAVVMHDSEAAARKAAIAESSERSGKWYRTTGTGSMEPLVAGRVFMAAVPKPYEELKVGEIVNYKPKWANGDTVVHRLVQKDRGGFIASGDNNPRSESEERVKPDNYLNTVVTIHTYKGAEQTRVKKEKP